MNSTIQTVFTGNTTINGQVKLFVFNCPSCGILFAIDNEYDNNRRNDGRDFYCPNRHVMSYDSRDQRERRRLAAENERLSDSLARANTRAITARQEAEHERRRVAAAKGRLTKLKNRIAKGVCPSCNRYFEPLHRHLAQEHPEYVLPEGITLEPTDA